MSRNVAEEIFCHFENGGRETEGVNSQARLFCSCIFYVLIMAVRLSKTFVALVLFSESGLGIQLATSTESVPTEQKLNGDLVNARKYESDFSDRAQNSRLPQFTRLNPGK